MFLKLESTYVKLIGDPHLGRKFVNGVPLHRRGEREKDQFAYFSKQLEELTGPDLQPVKTVICMGDLFDAFEVDNEFLLNTFIRLNTAVSSHPNVVYYILMGNHDVTRDRGRVSTFDILKAMFAKVDNLRFVTELSVAQLSDVSRPVLLCAYDAFTPTKQHVFPEKVGAGSDTTQVNKPYAGAFGHWDTVAFSEEAHNVIPYDKLSPLCDVIVTGHEHVPKTFTLPDQTPVIVTGSMLPYSHAEDPQGNIYVTKTLAEVEADPTLYKNKCLRIVLKKGELIPEGIEALQLTHKYVDDTAPDAAVEVVMEDFSMKKVFEETFTENGVSAETTQKYWDMYSEGDADAATA